jgi:tol-pal system protein YbgF
MWDFSVMAGCLRRGYLAKSKDKSVYSLAIVALAIGLSGAPSPMVAQESTLADIRQELVFVYSEIQRLRRELSTTGTNGLPTPSSAPALQRIDALEQEVRKLTGTIEQQQYHIEQVVKDGTNRIGDLEFRLCELEAGCDVTTLNRTAPLGGVTLPQSKPAVPVLPDNASDATSSEQNSFNQAFAAYEAGKYAAAAKMFESFALAFPGGPLTGEAYFWRGEALAKTDDWKEAALSYLESFSGTPAGVKAPEALYRLGISLSRLGQTEEACLMLSEVQARYPAAQIVAQANMEYSGLGCN